MRKRRITLPDGRYLIYYNFEDERAQSSPPADLANKRDKEQKAGQDTPAEQPADVES